MSGQILNTGKKYRGIYIVVLFAIIFCWIHTPLPAASKHSSKTSSKKSSTSKSAKSKSDSSDSDSSAETKKSASDKKEEASSDEDDDEASEEAQSSKSSSKRSRKESSESEADNDTTQTTATISQAIESAIKRYSSSKWGIAIRFLETGEVIFQKNATDGFMPASNRKIFTCALALDQLGPDFKFQTYVYYTGKIANGVLQGNLVIKPQGDPTFNNRMFPHQPIDWIYRKWADQVKAQGIQTVQGQLIVDCSDWDMNDLTPQGWASNVRQDYYAPQTSPLTINENVFEMKIKPGASVGDKPIIEYNPPAEGFPVIVNATTTEGGSRSLQVRKNENGMIEVNGKIGQKADTQSLGMPCDRPALYAACVFRSRLHSEGVQVMGDLRLVSARNAVPPPTSKNTIAMYPSPPLSEIVKTMMKHSDNHFAEQLYCAVSAIKLKHGSYKSSFQIESDLLRRAGINPGEVRFTDGCGLSRLDRVAPSQVCKMLDFMMRSPYAQAFFDALPIGGRDGTLRNRLQAKSVREKVFAKTGFINGVSCLSGYLLLQPQKTIVFSFLVNNVPGSTGGIKTMQDKLLGILAMLSV